MDVSLAIDLGAGVDRLGCFRGVNKNKKWVEILSLSRKLSRVDWGPGRVLFLPSLRFVLPCESGFEVEEWGPMCEGLHR